MRYRLRYPRTGLAAFVVCGILVAACGGESRSDGNTRVSEASVAASNARTSTLQAGETTAEELVTNPYEGNAREIAEGRRLYLWMNCHGCHGALGGGAIGPPLADADWIYGGESVHIYLSIMQGRPNGMPAFRGKLTDESAWRIAAYVRSLAVEDPPEPEQQGPTDQGALEGTRK